MRSRPALALLLAPVLACNGFRSETKTRTILIESTPPGAVATIANARGKQSLGATPAKADVEYVSERVEFTPWSILSTALTCGGTAALTAVAFGDGDQPLRVVSGTSAIIGGLICLGLTANTISSAVSDGDVVSSRYKDGEPTVAVLLAGHSDASRTLSNDEPFPTDPLRFELHPTEGQSQVFGVLAPQSGPVAQPGQPAQAAQPAGEKSVVAVFEVVSSDHSIKPAVLDQVTDYLASRLAETGRYRVVPREQLRRHLEAQKKESYRECMEESCQIELGKAVAAQLSLATKLLHVGAECAFSATLYDLKLEATSSGASVRTPCDADHLMDGVDRLVEKLTR